MHNTVYTNVWNIRIVCSTLEDTTPTFPVKVGHCISQSKWVDT